MTPGTIPDLQAVQIRRKYAVGVGLLLLLTASFAFGSAWQPGGSMRYLIEEGGLALIGVAIVGRAWCSLYIGGRKRTELVRQGPYALTRNPLYVFSFLGAAGVGAQTGSLILAGAFLAAAVAIFLPVIAREEHYLRHAFPADFADYARATPRIIPDARPIPAHAPILVDPAFFQRTLLDGLPFLVAWPLFDLVAWLHATNWPPLLRLY